MSKQADWQRCRYLWQDHMRIEAASRGYDFAAGAAARDAYLKACMAFKKNHGEAFDPHANDEPPRSPEDVIRRHAMTCFPPGGKIEVGKARRQGPVYVATVTHTTPEAVTYYEGFCGGGAVGLHSTGKRELPPLPLLASEP